MTVSLRHHQAVDDRVKGIPGGTAPFELEEIGAKGWNVLDWRY